MDDIFEQMLSTPSWVDGAVVLDPVRMDSTHKMQPSIPLPVTGAVDNQRLLLHAAPQERQEIGFDSHLQQQQEQQQLNKAGHDIRVSCRGSPAVAAVDDGALIELHGQASWREPFNHEGNMPLLPSNMGHFPLSREGMLNNLHLGKRGRIEEDTLNADMIAGVSPHGQGDLMLFSPDATESGLVRPRVRARRGQATDPHSIAERKRRERIAERMKALQELVPDSNKTDKASMLDEIISYVKFLQMQVKCLSMCRLGGAGAGAPLLADFPAQGSANFIAANLAQANVGSGSSSKDGLAFTEHQVAQLMDEDMSAAMQFLQSKGLCLMPISLATAMSSTDGKHPILSSKHSDVNEPFAVDMQPGPLAALANSGFSTNDHLTRLKITENTLRDESESDET